MVTSKNGSFNSVIRFYSPRLTRQPKLFANGFRVGNVGAAYDPEEYDF
jgi:hypothetical protein